MAAGLLSETWGYVSDTEANALLYGKYRGDGRRLDRWVMHDAIPIDWRDA